MALAHSGDGEKFGEESAEGPQSIKVDEQGIRAIGIKTVAVGMDTLKETLRATGDVQADETRAFNVTPSISGTVKQVFVKQGDVVKEGQVLAVIQSVDVANSLTVLMNERTKVLSEMARVKTQYANDIALQANQVKLSKITSDREESLLKLGISARKNYQEAKNALDSAQYRLDALKQKEAQEQSLLTHQLAVTTNTASGQLKVMGVSGDAVRGALKTGAVDPQLAIRAPVSGCIIKRQITLGERVDPSKSVFSIVNLSPIWVMVDIFQEQIPKVKEGQSVLLETPAKARLSGTISSIGTVVDSITKTIDVRIIANNDRQALRPGMFVTAEIILGESKQKGMLVPESSIVLYKERPFIYIRSSANGEFEPSEVTLGTKAGGQVELISGAKPGEQIVISGATQLMAQSILKAGNEHEHEGEKHEDHHEHEAEVTPSASPKAEIVIGFGMGIGFSIVAALIFLVISKLKKKPEGR